MRRTTRSRLVATASILLAACGAGSEPEPLPEGEPLSAFSSGFYLMASVATPVVRGGGPLTIGHVPDPHNYLLRVWLYRLNQDEGADPRCEVLSSRVIATLDGRQMLPVQDSQQHKSCTERVFHLYVRRSLFTEAGGNARIVLSDASHTVRAEFKDFYGPPRDLSQSPDESPHLPVLSCEGADGCIGLKPGGF